MNTITLMWSILTFLVNHRLTDIINGEKSALVIFSGFLKYDEIFSKGGLRFYMCEPLNEEEIERQFYSILAFSVLVIIKNMTIKPIDQVDHVGYRNEYVLKEGEVVYRRKEYTDRKIYEYSFYSEPLNPVNQSHPNPQIRTMSSAFESHSNGEWLRLSDSRIIFSHR